jgi:hypothetical protein
MHRAGFAVVLLMLAACVPPEQAQDGSSPKPLPPLAADKGAPLLALADHLLGQYFASDVAGDTTVCIGAHDGREEDALPPADEVALMMRHPALSPFASCGQVDGAWRDADSGDPAMVFTIHSFSCADADTCSGFGGYMAGASSSPSARYTMLWDGEAWQFTRDQRLLGGE